MDTRDVGQVTITIYEKGVVVRTESDLNTHRANHGRYSTAFTNWDEFSKFLKSHIVDKNEA